MLKYNGHSRTHRKQKRRRNNRIIIAFSILAILCLSLLLFLLLSNSDEPKKTAKGLDHANNTEESDNNEDTNGEIDANKNENKNEKEKNTETASVAEETEEEEDNIFADVILQEIESDEEDVIEAFVGNWPPIGTEQTEPHVTDYTEGSDDRIEIKRAVSLATNIEEDDLIELWIGNNGEQSVVSTVSNSDETKYYRIYLTWIENEGWQITQMERIEY